MQQKLCQGPGQSTDIFGPKEKRPNMRQKLGKRNSEMNVKPHKRLKIISVSLKTGLPALSTHPLGRETMGLDPIGNC